MKNLDKIMTEHGITGVVLCETSNMIELPKGEAGLGEPHISLLRNGVANYTKKTLYKVQRALQVLIPEKEITLKYIEYGED